MTDQPSQRDIARERTIANEYESYLINKIDPDKAAAIVAAVYMVPANDVPTIAQRVKQRDNG